MEIYKLNSSEWEIYRTLRLEALRESPQAFGDCFVESALLSDEHWKEEFENPKSFILVARDGGEPFAMAAAYQEDGEKMKHIAYVWGVYVKKAYRGKGIGKQLMESLLDEIAAIGEIEKVDLNVNASQLSAVRLYERLGFAVAGTLHKELKIGDQYFDEHVMEKFL
ncbi:MAG: Acetyltransferase [Candidatus Moranbacteria bacterium GW2011_GWC2_37_8]|nr:MAG: Acetyltransferase [Candidatus Moranbacteria bacterium GW2011_GWC2_37_8]KKQ62636.1 MAG: Acetyltransferase [Parcubacteria group bacterium GW2011_GWC1_38_22]KKQ81124.1 MAG: Acetyltransferase [Candidatus Moranbacteria bacterium GW2011_GWD2_38_7]